MRTTSSTNKKWLAGMIMLCLIVACGIVPTYAASYGDVLTVKVPYTHVYKADKNRTDDTFTYQVKPVGNSPAPQGSENGVYYFKIKGVPGGKTVSGTENLKIAFGKPGEYKYAVSSYVAKKKKGFTYDDRQYTLNIYATNKDGGGLQTLVTIVNEDGNKCEALHFKAKHKTEGDTRPITTPEGTPDHNPGNGGNGNNPGTAPAPAANNNNNDGILGTGLGVNDEGNLVSDDAPFSNIINNAVPKAKPEREYFSLLDLLLMLLTVFFAIVLYWRYFERIDTAADEYIIRREGKLRLLSIVPAIVAVWVFLFTQNIHDPKKFFADEWTPFLALALATNLALGIVAYRVYRDGEENTAQE